MALRGFTLIESLVVLFIFSIVCLTFFETYAIGTRLIIESKNRLGATALANQKIEIIRSIDYDTIGTKRWNGNAWVYGIPPGDILEDEMISVNTRNYHVHTFVQYVDHPYDGRLGASPSDAIPTDFKRVRVTVSWGDETIDQTVALITNVSPDGIESSTGGGVLSVNVLDASGAGVPGASVRIVNSASSVDVTTQTDATGNILLPGAPAGSQVYQLTVSKSGYYGASTFPPYPTTSYTPVDVHASVVNATLNQKTIVSDMASDIEIITEDPFGTAIPNIGFTLVGGRILGTTPPGGAIVHGFNESEATDSNGAASFPGESYGQYTFDSSDSRYRFWKLVPESTEADILDVIPGENKEGRAIHLDTELASVMVRIESAIDASSVSGAGVTLKNTTLLYEVTQTTDQFGFAYFPDDLPELTAGTYEIEVSATGYTSESDTVDVNGNLVDKNIELTPQ